MKVTDFELIDHGIHGSQYFQGCGTSFTSYEHVSTGCGDNPHEAVEDAIEQIACSHSVDVEDLYDRLIEAEGNNPFLKQGEDGKMKFPETPSAYEHFKENTDLTDEDEMNEMCETYRYISIRYNIG